MLALGNAVAAGDGELANNAGVIQGRPSSNFVTATRTADSHGPARFAWEYRRQIALPTFDREAVQHRAKKLHQGRFARFVRSVKDGHSIRQRID